MLMSKRPKYHDRSQTVGERAKSKLFGVIYSRTAIVILLLLLPYPLSGLQDPGEP